MLFNQAELARTESTLDEARNIWNQLRATWSSPVGLVQHQNQRLFLISQLNPKIKYLRVAASNMSMTISLSLGAMGMIQQAPGRVTYILQKFWTLMKEILDFAATTGKLRISYGKEFITVVWGEETVTASISYPIIEATLTMGEANVGPTMTPGTPTSNPFGTGGLRR